MKKSLLALLLVCASCSAFAFPGGDYYSSSLEQPVAQAHRYQMKEVLQGPGKVMLLRFEDLNTHKLFDRWVTEGELEQGQDGQVFLKSDVIPAGA
jgi:hypothetical protein